jgi:hypothetical protein
MENKGVKQGRAVDTLAIPGLEKCGAVPKLGTGFGTAPINNE